MTVIAWDGISVAADRQATCGYTINSMTKLYRLDDGTVIGVTGDTGTGLMLKQWYVDGMDPSKWPAMQADKDLWSRLIAFPPPAYRCVMYEQAPIAIPIDAPFYAWGSGAEFAIGAMAAGASAEEAVAIANDHCTTCGMGVQVIELARHEMTGRG